MDSSMDIDGPEFILEVNEAIAAVRLRKTGDMKDTFSQQPTTSTCFQRVAVIDTNFLISNLSYLQHLLTEAEKHPDVLLAIIPWTVVLELDGLKSQQREGGMTQLEERARRAIRFLEATLQRKSSGLRGQRRDEVYDRNTAQTVKGDDHILDCCMYFRYHMEKPVLLLSNDRNLCVKAMIHHIDALSAEDKTRMVDLLSMVAKGEKGMQVDTSYNREILPEDNHSIIDEDEVMMDVDESRFIDKETNFTSGSSSGIKSSSNGIHHKKDQGTGGLHLSRYATTDTHRTPAIIESRSHWHNEYYRQGMDLKKK